jgi:hypothetical protein
MALFNKDDNREKLSITVSGKKDRNDQFKDIFEVLVAGFARIFDKKDLYSMRIDFTFNKVRDGKSAGTVVTDEALDNVDVVD